MDIQPQSQQPISDDQELAKVLAGITGEDADKDAKKPQPQDDNLVPTPDTPMPDAPMPEPAAEEPVTPEPAPAPAEEPVADELGPMPEPAATAPAPLAADDSELSQIKQEALGELRPLVDKLNVGPEEKFDTYLLLLRSTDDKTLIAPAHEAAKTITDEARRAQALLDVIKEIDFLSNPENK